MEADNLVFLSGTVLHVLVAGILMVYFHLRVKAHALTAGKAKSRYTWLCLALGICAGIGIINTLAFLDIPTGHGEILLAAALANLMLAAILMTVGRIVIGWVPMQW